MSQHTSASPPPQGKATVTARNHSIRLMDHCIFCVRKTTVSNNSNPIAMDSDMTERLEEVPCFEECASTAVTLLSTLNKTWVYLQDGGNWKWDNDFNQILAQFTRLPKLCRFCAEQLAVIDNLISLLVKEINTLGTLLRESRYGGRHSWRAERFEQTLRSSGTDWNTIVDTLTFLGKPPPTIASPGAESEFLRQSKLEEGDDDSGTTVGDTNVNVNSSYLKDEQTNLSECEEDDGEWQADFENDTEVVHPPEVGPVSIENNVPRGKCDEATFVCELNPATGKKIFKCVINNCVKTFASLSATRYHHREVHKYYCRKFVKVKAILCKFCGERFPNKRTYQSHKIVCNCSRTPACDLCRTRLPIEDMYEHVRSHVGDYLVKCPNPVCLSNTFCTIKGLSDHLSTSKACQESVSHSQAEQHLRNKQFCEVCDREFDQINSLRQHIILSHEKDEKPFACPLQYCQKRFSVLQSVLLHLCLHATQPNAVAENIQKCDVCQENMRVEDMEGHLKDIHCATGVIKCTHCPFLLTSRETLVEHLFVHRYSVLSCDICEVESSPKFRTYNELRKHYFDVHQIGTKLVCELCSWESLSRRNLQQHKLRFHPPLRKDGTTGLTTSTNEDVREAVRKLPFKCKECDTAFRLHESLTDHRIAVHGRKPLVCHICSAKFATNLERKQHQKEHVELVRTFPCGVPECGKVCPTKNSLMYHVASFHTGERPHVCEHCGKSFITKMQMVTHIHRIHDPSTSGKFRCDVPGCEKIYKDKVSLNRHSVAAHNNGDKPHVCEQCGKSFFDKRGLNGHIKYSHMDTPSLICDNCGETFKTEKSLRRHKLIHTGERPFVCNICSQRFRQVGVLRTHLKGHQKKGTDFKPNGPMKNIRKRVEKKPCN